MSEFEVGKDYILNTDSDIKFNVIKLLEDRYEVSNLNTGFINYVSKGIESNYTDVKTVRDNVTSYFSMPMITVNTLSEIKEPKENIRYRDKSSDCDVLYKNNVFVRVNNLFR